MDLRSLRYFVAVAEERHFGRAAARLHMTQPPLSRAVKRLETDLGAVLLHRSPAGVSLTDAGTALYEEARTLLEAAERARARVTAAANLTLGTLGDGVDQTGTAVAARFRERHPGVRIILREADLSDPAAGLRAGLVDVALTRLPFDDRGIGTHVLRDDPVGALLRADDPLAGRESLAVRELADRAWFRLPEGTDPRWRAYWNAVPPGSPLREGPVIRTVHECVQAVLWNGTVGLVPLAHPVPDGLTTVPLSDVPPSRVVLAWRRAWTPPLVRSFVELARGG
ncbi:LysR family transcriptional regulator [Amycolatopsis jiangsuensis]|uniref:DNA-binding transcriptional LysR family regulator n=1 Tax=Amycolatopsis jiangsuensis TaxID=1181879 RepID=A0A840J1J5_9PSEU|nr:LysR family transcriptional regulator [Amycolatopsis jiangsuensis]MBB4688876.1 DNA-binding transcriptional LysR family regulator [Amycolatopsis jiangsuensis]